MNVVTVAEAKYLAILANRSTDVSSNRLRYLAMDKFEMAIQSTPDNRMTLDDYAKTLFSFAKREPFKSYEFYQKAVENSLMCTNSDLLIDMGKHLLEIHQNRPNEQQHLLRLANECFKNLLDMIQISHPSYALVYYQWARVLLAQAHTLCDSLLFAEAGSFLLSPSLL